jgi:hypothetical protein
MHIVRAIEVVKEIKRLIQGEIEEPARPLSPLHAVAVVQDYDCSGREMPPYGPPARERRARKG